MSCKMLRCLIQEIGISFSNELSASIFMAKDISKHNVYHPEMFEV
jgi:hypothetical protein